eukprot:CAMPEP_0195021788 /NCGR_PEP_ID=MMETSP0326_2-20130528/38813_1 /TAXON_ID=2866 ORGANISM="Crypthecodinium cohnii, Strain Seligo" /NCGR_SAMPLE_ID=MMETSP0326_2 /ASSEMBLY_ACC=CAM_ASM_000348 /LENGTH=36 /DNA_ID= /DNA_START= /DNA_END= /DNA_ORIENTATION=
MSPMGQNLRKCVPPLRKPKANVCLRMSMLKISSSSC